MISSKCIYFFGVLGGLMIGYDSGVISGTLHFLTGDLRINNNSINEGFIVASTIGGAVLGALVIGKIADIIGRQKGLLIAAVLFCIGALSSGLAADSPSLIIARIILGIAVGATSVIVPIYLAELAQANRRGTLAFLNQLMIVLGILLSYVVNLILINVGSEEWNTEIGWRIALGIVIVPSLLLLFGSFLLPESPRHLVRIGDDSGVHAVLVRLNRPNSIIDTEIDNIRKTLSERRILLKEVTSKYVRPALMVGIGLALFQQLTGINTVIYYAPKILETAGLDEYNQRLVTVIIGVMNVIATLIVIKIIDKINRRTLLTIGGSAMCILLMLMAGVDYFKLVDTNSTTAVTVQSVLLILYILMFGATWGGVMWVILGEIFPLQVRGIGVGIASTVNWVANFSVALLFPYLLGRAANDADCFTDCSSPTMLGGHPFILFVAMAIFSALAVVFTRVVVFETRGKTLEEIETELQARVMK